MNANAAPSYFHYWGKTEKDTGSYHLLPFHCLDVAAVAAAWWDKSHAIRHCFRLNSRLNEEQIKAWVIFFVALHDYGKFDVRFQIRAKYVWEVIYPGAGSYCLLPGVSDCRRYLHGEGGLFWFMQDHDKIYGSVSSGDRLDFLDALEDTSSELWNSWKPWIEAVTGHHGCIRLSEYVCEAPLPPASDKRLGMADREARCLWLYSLEQLFLKPTGLSLSDSPPACSQTFLAGFCSIADWLGSQSDTDHFIFNGKPHDLAEYYDERCKADAPHILELAGVVGRSRPYGGVSCLLKPDTQPRCMQTLVDGLPVKPGMTMVEAPTGSGKTEAAMAYAWRLIAEGMADSIVFALPTQATANAMWGRLERIAPMVFKDHPNLLLAHGAARFNNDFGRIKQASVEGYELEDGAVQCSRWLAESRKRVFLGQIGVCTIDQVLVSVLPVRHSFVRGFGVGRSILIVDEVHAYDAYMYGLLEEVLRQQKKAGGSAILLSATLPEEQRRRLFAAWGINPETKGQEDPYPLLLWTDGDSWLPCELNYHNMPEDREVLVEPIRMADLMPDENLLRRVVDAAERGAQVAVVCNMVITAQAVARKLRSMTSKPVDLFHARYCYAHRREKEADAIEHFGPGGLRTTGRILVATQVVEQSLDLDFDWLITQLCPVDLLFQRMGRLHRHNRPRRPSGCERPLCTVLLPQVDDHRIHEKIYSNSCVLWRTAEKLLAAPHGAVVFPEAYRTWIESVYQDEPWENEPPEQTAAFEEFKHNVEDVKRYLAMQMLGLARGMTPFADSEDAFTAVTRDGDMNLTVVPYYRTAKGKFLLDGTLLESLNEYQQLEALALNSVGVPSSWGRYLEDHVEGRFWLEMQPEGDGFRGRSKGATFRYHKDIGLEKEK
ncbi:MAG TPA: CRISPR-associated helicase/endonuclease Cas3 [Methanoregulaceae archaeon]|nr:CRISPR-associated helicase/endonuclease Cas3 [Methanoregulaceae archaeon]